MRRWSSWCLFLPLFLGCAGKNVVAGEEKTEAEGLRSALPSWCLSTCTRLRACPENSGCDCSGDVCDCVGVDSGCEEQCPKAFAPYTEGGEVCAVIGQRVKACLDAVECSDLSGRDPCPVTDAERALCPDPTERGDDPPRGSDGDPGVPVLATGGTSSTGGPVVTAGTTSVPTTGGSHAGANPVSCQGSYAVGGAATMPGSQVTCEEGRMGCTDGHQYSWICARDSQGQRACSCLLDAHATAGFEPVNDCPDLSAVNAGCGWALLP